MEKRRLIREFCLIGIIFFVGLFVMRAVLPTHTLLDLYLKFIHVLLFLSAIIYIIAANLFISGLFKEAKTLIIIYSLFLFAYITPLVKGYFGIFRNFPKILVPLSLSFYILCLMVFIAVRIYSMLKFQLKNGYGWKDFFALRVFKICIAATLFLILPLESGIVCKEYVKGGVCYPYYLLPIHEMFEIMRYFPYGMRSSLKIVIPLQLWDMLTKPLFYAEIIIAYLVSCLIIYYLTRPKVKEQFK